MGTPGPHRLSALLCRPDLPATFERWRVTLAAGDERRTDAAEWAGAFVCIEAGRVEVDCTRGGTRTFEAGDLLALGWLPLRAIRNAGPAEASILAVRRRDRRATHQPSGPAREPIPVPNRRERGEEMATDRPQTVDDYLATLPEHQRAALQHLREVIRAAAPNATEGISYAVPAFKQDGMLVTFHAARDHLTFHLNGTDLMDTFRPELEGRKLTAGGIHFTPDQPLPDALVVRMVEARVTENAERKAARARGKR